MIDEHSKEDELMIQIIGLQGKIERLEKEKQEQIGEFLEDLNKCVNIYQYNKLKKKWDAKK